MQPALQSRKPAARLGSLALPLLLILIFAGVRLGDLMRFPIFIDEAIHVDWANDVYALRPLTGAANGKLFGLWWMALMGMEGDQALFLARAATVLFSVIGAALLYRLGAMLTGRRAGLLGLILYAAAPYSFFYDRMALVDSYVAPWALLALWFAVRHVRHARRLDAAAAGLCITGAILAKATGVTLIAVPLLAILLVPGALTFKGRLRGVTLSAAAWGLSSGLLYAFLTWRGYAYFGTATSVVGTGTSDNLLVRFLHNLQAQWTINTTYLSLPLLLIGIGLVLFLLRWQTRLGLFLLLTTALPLAGLLAFATKMSARYFQFHVPLLLLAIAAAAVMIEARLRRRWPAARWLLPLLTMGWLIGFALPFWAHNLSDPGNLPITPLDREEYISSESAGFALPEVAAFLIEQAADAPQPGVVIGLIANCLALDYAIPKDAPLTVECPPLLLDGSHQPAIVARTAQLVASGMPSWIVYEDLPYTGLQGIGATLTQLACFRRPFATVPIQVYRVGRVTE